MTIAAQIVEDIIDAIRSGRDLYVHDHFIEGPDRLARVRTVLLERRDNCADPEETAFLTSIIIGLEQDES